MSTPTTSRRHAGRALVIFESFFGNTERVAGAVAAGLNLEGWSADVLDVAAIDADAVDGVDLIVVGAPTHAFALSRPSTREEAVGLGGRNCYSQGGLREWLERLPLSSSGSRLAATFDTRVSKVHLLPASASRSAAHILRSKGFRLVVKPAGFIVKGVDGPLESRESEHAIAWGRTVVREAELADAAAHLA